MCSTCGCSQKAETVVTNPADRAPDHGSSRSHGHDDHDHAHRHPHQDGERRVVKLEQDILARNNLIAERNRGWFEGREILAVNLMSAPGAGKTALLERTIADLRGELEISVIEGDQATLRDAERIRKTGSRVVQINTGSGCHLDAAMLDRALHELDPPRRSVLMIENVGNLVCPALFDLGEGARVVIMSVTEGEDKPLKYPHMFRAADAIVLSKSDLLPHLEFDLPLCIQYARRVNPGAGLLQTSVRTGAGLDSWYRWLRGRRR